MGIPPGAGHSQRCMGFLFQHVTVAVFPAGEIYLPHLRIRWSLHEQKQSGNPSQLLRCLKRAVEWEQSFCLSFDVCKTPLMGNGAEMRSNCRNDCSFPVAHRSRGNPRVQQIRECLNIPTNCLVGFASHEGPEEILAGGDVSLDEEDTHSPQPFPITAIDPRSSGDCCRREKMPELCCRQRVIQKNSQPDRQCGTAPVMGFQNMCTVPVSFDKMKEFQKVVPGYWCPETANEGVGADTTLISSFSRAVIAVALGRSKTKRAADSIGRKDVRFFIDTVLTGI